MNVETNYELEHVGESWKITTINGGCSSGGQPVDIE
jgi:hypothetical protein